MDRVKIMVFYPVDGVSRVQKLQMATQTGDNLRVVAIKETLTMRRPVSKNIFADREMAERSERARVYPVQCQLHQLGTSCPADRLLHFRLLRPAEQGCHPQRGANRRLRADRKLRQHFRRISCQTDGTAYPAAGLRLNRNNVLTDFLATGTYDLQSSVPSDHVPSMDILISSNLERLLCPMAGEQKTAAYMESLRKTGSYTVDAEVPRISARASPATSPGRTRPPRPSASFSRMKATSPIPTRQSDLLAQSSTRRSIPAIQRPWWVASTASPFKFAADVYMSLTDGTKLPRDPLSALDQLAAELTGADIPYPLCGLRERTVRFRETIPRTPCRRQCRISAGNNPASGTRRRRRADARRRRVRPLVCLLGLGLEGGAGSVTAGGCVSRSYRDFTRGAAIVRIVVYAVFDVTGYALDVLAAALFSVFLVHVFRPFLSGFRKPYGMRFGGAFLRQQSRCYHRRVVAAVIVCRGRAVYSRMYSPDPGRIGGFFLSCRFLP